jgi:phosphatidylglycerol:prolipoprotein diacylglycerol transferase
VRPVLIQFGDFALPSYGFMLVVSFIAAIIFVRRVAKKNNISPSIIENLAFYIMLGVVVGGRILYVIFHWPQYQHDILGIVRIWEGGMMFFGGFIGGLIAGIMYLKHEKIAILRVGDLIAPAIGLGEFFTRIGCFLNGCCFGIPSDLPWAIRFPDECVAGNSPVAAFTLHPTQLYSSLFGLALFLFLWRRLNKIHKTGEIFAQYLMFSGIFRFGVDFVRYYEDGANFWINQIIALATVIVGAIIFLRVINKKA